ncbi:hypothetical protein ACQ86N_40955 [Puia sp. P3]|uniref:hypothetical protein n=1 Tax=Puia sp. P3 TaxID=3423952 RepID=UPI003D67BF39
MTLTYGDGTARAQVFEDFYHRQICVAASGADARGLIMLIMNEMTNIIDGYKGVEADLSVPCNCPVCLTSETPIFFKHKELLRWSKRGTVFCNESGTSMSINELLFNVGLINPLKETTRSETTSARPLKAFISYSRLDGESREEGGYDYLSQFKKHLAPLAKYSELIQTWDDTLLIAGEDWDDRIRDELQKSDVIFLLISVNFLNTPTSRTPNSG